MLPTRTMKNSSRLVVKMERNLNRSSRGVASQLASSSTRSLNFSQDSSRFCIQGASSLPFIPLHTPFLVCSIRSMR